MKNLQGNMPSIHKKITQFLRVEMNNSFSHKNEITMKLRQQKITNLIKPSLLHISSKKASTLSLMQ